MADREWFDEVKSFALRGSPIDESWIKKDLKDRLGVGPIEKFVGPPCPKEIRKKKDRAIRFKRNLQKAMHHYEKVGFRYL